MERDAARVQMKECRRDCLARQFDGLRQRQGRWCCGHGRARQSDNGTDGAEIIRVLIRIRSRRRQLLSGLYRRRSLCRNRMEVAERKRKLNGERKQRSSRAKSDLRPHPLHADHAPRRKPVTPQWFRRYNITSQARRLDVNHRQCRKTICELVLREAPRHGCETRRDQRPSRSQVAAKAPSSSNNPIRPAKTGKTPTPLTTLASRIFTPIQPSPRKTLDE